MHESFSVETQAPRHCIDITDTVREVVRRAAPAEALCHVMVLHSTAAIVVNETNDPNIGADIFAALDRAVPEHAGWLHDRIDDNAHSHIKAATLGPSELLRIRDGALVLGRWQGIYFMEFDGPRTRNVSVGIVPDGRS